MIGNKPAEDDPLRTAALLRAIGDASLDLIFAKDRDGRLIYVNAAYSRLVGRPVHEILGLTTLDVAADPADARAIMDSDRRIIESGVAEVLEEPFTNADGVRRIFRSARTPMRSPDGTVLGVAVVATDITHRARSEQELRETRDRLQMAAGAADLGTWDYDPAADVLDWDARCKALFGVSADAPVTYRGTFVAGLHDEDREPVLAAVAKALSPDGPGSYDVEYRTVGRDDGVIRWVAATGRAIFENGEPVRFIGTIRDITGAKRVAQALREETLALEILNRTGTAVAGELDLERLVQMVTDAGVEITGAAFGAFFYNVVDAAGESYMLYTLSGAEPSQFDFGMPRATAVFHPTFVGEGVVRSNDILLDPRYGQMAPHFGMPAGHLPVRSYLAVSVTSRNGKVIGGLFFGHPEPGRFTDRHERLMTAVAAQAAIAIDNAQLYLEAQSEVIERKRAEDELRELNETLEQRVSTAVAEREQAEDALRQAQKMEAVGQLTGGIAHDFNNLLTVVLGNIDMARRAVESSGGDARTKRALDHAQKGAERAASLTQRLLAFSRRQPLDPKPLDINKLVLGMSDLLGRALGETIRTEIVTSSGLWRVEADPNQLESAILNLAVNARDAMPDGGSLTIETGNTRLDESYSASQAEVAPGPYVMIAVTDTGGGMPREVLARVFEPFFTTKDVGRGTGLGLSQVYGFVKQSGGHVKIYSEEGEGTTVKLYLPRLLVDAPPEEDQKPGAIEVGRHDETILVVEDDDDVRAFTVEILRATGYRVLEAHDGPSALRLLERQSEPIDLLFTDVVMPGMSGRELAEIARTRQAGMKVLYTSGYTREAIVHGGRLEHGVDIIAKPFTFQSLSQKVRDMLDKGQSGRLLCVQPEDCDGSLCAALRDLGYALDESATAAEALGRVRANAGRYDAVIVDEALQDRSGEGIANTIRSLFRDVPVLLMSTADKAAELRARFAEDPCTDVAEKPIEPARLEAQLRELGVRCAQSGKADGEAS